MTEEEKPQTVPPLESILGLDLFDPEGIVPRVAERRRQLEAEGKSTAWCRVTRHDYERARRLRKMRDKLICDWSPKISYWRKKPMMLEPPDENPWEEAWRNRGKSS